MTSVKTYFWGETIELTVGQKVFVGHSGSGHSVFGELATFVGASAKFLNFVSDSGKKFKTQRNFLDRFSSSRQYGDNIWVSPYIDREYLNMPLFDFTTLRK